ncbi:MAG: ribonuclease P protein component 2 [Candidatus Aenigmatarchaeota archaeon]|nr:MAG: ribonuclease P protein component 2 [Candidatus Aenigmarchaeota archaeon]
MADKPKTLPPTLREKKRYLAFEIISEKPLRFDAIVDAFWNALLTLLGELGTARTNVWFVKDAWDEKRQRGLVRCGHVQVENVRVALALITSIGGVRVIPHSLGVSGTMEGARKKFLGERTLKDFADET